MDETTYMQGKWRCAECDTLNSMETDNVCRVCSGEVCDGCDKANSFTCCAAERGQ